MKDNNQTITYAAYSNNFNNRINSSSGGVFSTFAEYVLDDAGIVYGVGMSDDCKTAEFVRVIDKSELYKIRGSKYIQANARIVYQNVKSDLEHGKKVLFSGVGCQITGLKKYLELLHINDSKLYCLDVICHGVPSPGLWREYVDYIEKKYNARLSAVNFRCKEKGWVNFGTYERYDDKKTIFEHKDKNPYMLMFLRNYSLRPSCYACMAKSHKIADVTIGDFWGIDEVIKNGTMNDGYGTSLVIVRTKKGEELFGAIANCMQVCETDYIESVKYNPAEYESVYRPDERDVFFVDMNKIEFEGLIEKYGLPDKISWKRKLLNHSKKIIISLFGGGGINDNAYGVLFTFAKKMRDLLNGESLRQLWIRWKR